MFKDEVLCRLSEKGNIAQFVSFSPEVKPRFARLLGYETDSPEGTLESLIEKALSTAPEGSVNVRSFEPDNPKSRDFVYGLKNVSEVADNVRRLAAQGLTTIVNETVDINDGGVSGVFVNGVMEFAPKDTPRCVEKEGVCSLNTRTGIHVLYSVYGIVPNFSYVNGTRIEWSIHPLKRGVRNDNTILWELEEIDSTPATPKMIWPNRFSEFIGDKVFGLLIADSLGLLVPKTTAISRNVSPFTFGKPTGTGEHWIRTCPNVQTPGKFTTRRGWIDPFKLMQEEDPTGEFIASVLSQEGVKAGYSGAAFGKGSNGAVIEGVTGFGDEFMQGSEAPTQLPDEVITDVFETSTKLSSLLGSHRFEWVRDTDGRVWIVQLHRGEINSTSDVIVPGDADSWVSFDPKSGLENLRSLVSEVKETGSGIILTGNVGITSHFGDILRKSSIPSRIEISQN